MDSELNYQISAYKNKYFRTSSLLFNSFVGAFEKAKSLYDHDMESIDKTIKKKKEIYEELSSRINAEIELLKLRAQKDQDHLFLVRYLYAWKQESRKIQDELLDLTQEKVFMISAFDLVLLEMKNKFSLQRRILYGYVLFQAVIIALVYFL